jgi:phenylpropionate dioxygenase-like ring-hydroxylating dioxygenase large terminal subunit
MSETVKIVAQEGAGSEPAQRVERGADAGFLWDFWYPAARSSAIEGRQLTTAMLLEVPLVMGRSDKGKAFALRDACPHRGIPLSYGRFDGTNVECSYHGWKFNGCSGRCVEIPSLTSQDKLKVERIFAGHYPCE